MTKEEAFEKLKEFSKKLDTISYDEIYTLLRESVRRIPIPLAKFHKNGELDRARLNKGDALYNSLDDLGYIKDRNVIDNFLTMDVQINHIRLCSMVQSKRLRLINPE